MGERKVSTSSALAHRASCASLSHVSSLRSSRDIFATPFLGPLRHHDVRDGDRRKSGWSADADGRGASRLAPSGLHGRTAKLVYRFRDGAAPRIKVPTPDARAAPGPCQDLSTARGT